MAIVALVIALIALGVGIFNHASISGLREPRGPDGRFVRRQGHE